VITRDEGLSLRRMSRVLTVIAAGIAVASFVKYRPRPAVIAPDGPLDAKPIAGLEGVDFGSEPTVDPDHALVGEIPRRVLALYNGGETTFEDDEQTGRSNAIERKIDAEVAVAHKLAELPLNHLGLVVDFQDVNQDPLPTRQEMKRYRGVLAWFGDHRVRSPDAYLAWLREQLAADRRVVVIGDLPLLQDRSGKSADQGAIEGVLRLLGAELEGRPIEDPSAIGVAMADPEVIGFERKLPERIELYHRYRALGSSRVYLRLARFETEDGKPRAIAPSDVVWTSARGGFAAAPFATMEDHVEDRWVTRWIINPFVFFERAFGVEHLPRLDFTTLNGRRIYYGHVDGDGLDTISEIDSKSRCGAIIRDRIFKKYDLPFTASVVVGGVAPPPVGSGKYFSPENIAVARSIFALDNVEVASHGLAHPMDWRAGANMTVAVTDIPGYQMTAEAEIKDSVEYINHELAPASKPCRIMLWTGSCNPNEEQIGWAYRLRLRNLNGGDPRMDSFYPSYAHLVPPLHPVGRWFQYYTSAANDFIHTQDWTPPYYRFQNVIQTFERSGSPRRIVPVNVYVHYYSARNVAALIGLERAMDWVAAHPLAPIFASEYVDIARDFHWARIAEEGERRFVVEKGPHLRTVRFDGKDVRVDLARSTGVLGYLYDESLGVTYVHLDESARSTIQISAEKIEPRRLESASHWVEQLQLGAKKIVFVTRGVGRKSFVFAGLAPGSRFGWAAKIDSGTVISGETTADERGRLRLELEDHSTQRVPILIEQRGAE
jgi:hypothetical protein